jgi:hypothetical protein
MDPDWLPTPQFWVSCIALARRDIEIARRAWHLAFKDVTAPTNVRTMIASVVPVAAFGNTLPIIITETELDTCLLAGALNSFALDYVARQKVQGQHLNWYVVEQLPILPPAAYARAFGPKTAVDIVRADVLALTYTAHDMAVFAQDMGHVDATGTVLPPFPWNEDDRRRRRARLDALHFLLYGLSRSDAAYILSTFPIVERDDHARHGRYLTRDLILAWMAALAAGEPDAKIVG